MNIRNLTLLFLALLTSSAVAMTWPVTSTSDNPADTASLRYAVNHYIGGDLISLEANGTILLTGGELLLSQSVVIAGPGATNLSILGDDNNRIFHLTGGDAVIVAIYGLRLSSGILGTKGADSTSTSQPGGGGADANAGCILNGELTAVDEGVTLTVSNCVFDGCYVRGGDGGAGISGIFNATAGGLGGKATGGAIYTSGGALFLSGCTFSSNSATGGNGGPGGTGYSGFSAGAGGAGGEADGGAIVSGYFGTKFEMENCTFAANLALSGKGGLGGNCIVNGIPGPGGPTDGASGGAICINNLASLSDGLVNCTISQNTVMSGGGGGGGTNMSSSVVAASGANAPASGGGLAGQSVPIENTIIAGNSSVGGADGVIPDVSMNPVTSRGNNLIGEADGSSGWVSKDLTGTVATPLDPMLGPLQDNGGPTPTMALMPCSPAMDNGNDAVDPATDQCGLPRLSGIHVDIGAYELQGTPPPCLSVAASCEGVVLETPSLTNYPFNSVVTLTAVPSIGWTFSGWAGDASGTMNPMPLTVTSAAAVTATFSPLSPACMCMLDGLVAWWPGGNNANDIAGANNGALMNGATFASGKAGTAFSFDGVDDYVDFGSGAGNFGTGDFTAEFWIKTTSTRIEYLLGKRTGCGHASFWDLRLDASGVLEAEVDQDANGDNYLDVIGSHPVNNGSFHHVAMVRQGSSLYTFIDGTADAGGTAAGIASISNSGSVTAGKTGCAGFNPSLHYFTGLLDEISLYNRALSGTEINAIYAAGSAGKCLTPLCVTNVSKAGSNLTISWLAQRGLTYRVQYTTQPGSGSWTDVPGDVTAGGSSASKTDVLPANAPQRFYRVLMFR